MMSPRPRLPLVVVAVAAGFLVAACGGGATDGSMSATIDGISWHTPGEGFIVTGPDGTSFDLLGATYLPNSLLLDSSKPQLLIVFSQVPSPGTFGIDGRVVNVQYQVDLSTIYSGGSGSVQVTSINTSRAEGTFSFELQSPVNDPTVLTMTDGAFDVPVSAH